MSTAQQFTQPSRRRFLKTSTAVADGEYAEYRKGFEIVV